MERVLYWIQDAQGANKRQKFVLWPSSLFCADVISNWLSSSLEKIFSLSNADLHHSWYLVEKNSHIISQMHVSLLIYSSVKKLWKKLQVQTINARNYISVQLPLEHWCHRRRRCSSTAVLFAPLPPAAHGVGPCPGSPSGTLWSSLSTTHQTPQHTLQLKGSRWQTGLGPTPGPKIVFFIFSTTEVLREKQRIELEGKREEQVDGCHVFHIYLCTIKHFFSDLQLSVPCGRFFPPLVVRTTQVLSQLHSSSLHLFIPNSISCLCWHRGR